MFCSLFLGTLHVSKSVNCHCALNFVTLSTLLLHQQGTGEKSDNGDVIIRAADNWDDTRAEVRRLRAAAPRYLSNGSLAALPLRLGVHNVQGTYIGVLPFQSGVQDAQGTHLVNKAFTCRNTPSLFAHFLASQILSSGVSLKRSCKMQFRRVHLVSIGLFDCPTQLISTWIFICVPWQS